MSLKNEPSSESRSSLVVGGDVALNGDLDLGFPGTTAISKIHVTPSLLLYYSQA